MQTRDSTVSTPRPRQAGPAICTADPGGRPPLRQKIRRPPPRPPALARKQAPNPSLTPALRRYRHGQTRNPSHFACGTADNGATPEPFARPVEAMRGLPDLYCESPRPHHRHHGSRICTAGSRVPVEPPPGSRSLLPSASPTTPAVRRANPGCADKANKRPHQTPVCRLPAPHATSYLTQLKESDVRCISYLYPYRGWLAGWDHAYLLEGALQSPSCYARQRTQSRRHGRQASYEILPPKRTTMPYQQGQPTSCFLLLRTHSTTASSAMSTHPKPLAQSQPMPVPSRHADFHPTHPPSRLSTSSNNATAPPT